MANPVANRETPLPTALRTRKTPKKNGRNVVDPFTQRSKHKGVMALVADRCIDTPIEHRPSDTITHSSIRPEHGIICLITPNDRIHMSSRTAGVSSASVCVSFETRGQYTTTQAYTLTTDRAFTHIRFVMRNNILGVWVSKRAPRNCARQSDPRSRTGCAKPGMR